MRSQTTNAIRLSFLFALLLLCGVLTASAQRQGGAQPETFGATAGYKSAGGLSVSAPMTVVLRRKSTDAQRDQLLAAVKNGTGAVLNVLGSFPDAGTLMVGARQNVIKYAYARTTGDGQLLTLVTAKPIVYINNAKDDAKPKAGYDLGLVLLEVHASGPGTGEMTPAAKVKVDANGAIVTEDHSGETVHLTNVVKK